ncbi:MAG: Phosphoesterase [Actinomycetia bacterium]|nr:Phosphoesterase [Actinomycetes bacterium]
MRALVLSDTHIRPGRNRKLPNAVYAALAEADVILHAGDIVTWDLLDELSGFAPVHAVLGNNDHALIGDLPESLELELDGVRVAMVHDSGPTQGRARRMHQRFPDAALVVYGHSHAPFDGPGDAGQLLLNPGSPTERRAQPRHSFGLLDLDAGTVASRLVYI